MGTRTVLLVDEDAGVRKFTSLVLRREGFQVLEAGDGLVALSLCRQIRQTIDLLITDMTTPGMGGLELREAMCQLHPHMKTLLVSGGAGFAYTTCDSTAFLAKPYRAETLLGQIQELIPDFLPAQRPAMSGVPDGFGRPLFGSLTTAMKKTKRALVVDGETGNLSFIATLLGRNGFDTMAVARLTDVVNTLDNSTRPFELVVLELSVPAEPVIAVAERILALSESVRFLFTSTSRAPAWADE